MKIPNGETLSYNTQDDQESDHIINVRTLLIVIVRTTFL